jgi:O-antigen ligase
VLIALFLAGAAEAILGAVQFIVPLGPPAFAVGNFIRAHGMFGQPNPFAGYLGTIFPIALAMTLIPHPGRFRTIAPICMALIGLGIFLSLSRGAWLGLTISLGVMAMAWSARARKMVIPMAACIVLVVALAMAGLLPPNISARITSATDNFGVFDVRTVQLTSENFAIVERMAHWQAGWHMFEDHPLTGVGTGNYNANYPDYFVRETFVTSQGHAHNFYIHMLAENGIVGLAIYLTLILSFLFVALRVALATTDRLTWALALGALGTMSAVYVHNMFENLHVLNLGIQLSISWALAIAAHHRWSTREAAFEVSRVEYSRR